MAFRRPVWTLGVLVLGFAVYATFEGVSALFAALRGWSYRRDRWLLLLEADAGIGVGILALHSPGMTAYVLTLFIAVWALTTGILRIIEAVNLRDVSGRGRLAVAGLAVGGLASIILTLLVLFRPVTGALAMVTLIGIYALILGVTENRLSVQSTRSTRLGVGSLATGTSSSSLMPKFALNNVEKRACKSAEHS